MPPEPRSARSAASVLPHTMACRIMLRRISGWAKVVSTNWASAPVSALASTHPDKDLARALQCMSRISRVITKMPALLAEKMVSYSAPSFAISARSTRSRCKASSWLLSSVLALRTRAPSSSCSCSGGTSSCFMLPGTMDRKRSANWTMGRETSLVANRYSSRATPRLWPSMIDASTDACARAEARNTAMLASIRRVPVSSVRSKGECNARSTHWPPASAGAGRLLPPELTQARPLGSRTSTNPAKGFSDRPSTTSCSRMASPAYAPMVAVFSTAISKPFRVSSP